MPQLVTPTTALFGDAIIDSEAPSYVAQTLQKFNRPWLLYSVSDYTSIIVPDRSGTLHENYAGRYTVSTATDGHFAHSGFDIPNAIVIHGAEHQYLHDWEELNPDMQERADFLKSKSPQVAHTLSEYLKEYGKFAQNTQKSKYPEDLPTTNFLSTDFTIMSKSPLQFRHEHIPSRYLGLEENLEPAMLFSDYPKTVKRRFSNKHTQLTVDGDIHEFEATYVTPLQAKTLDVLERMNAPKQYELTNYMALSFHGSHPSAREYFKTYQKDLQGFLDRSEQKQQEKAEYLSEGTKMVHKAAHKKHPSRKKIPDEVEL